MNGKPLFVMLPDGTRAEVEAARAALGKREGVVMCHGRSHTAGQPLNGDVIVIGWSPPEIDKDAAGKVTRYDTMDAFLAASKPSARGGEGASAPAVAHTAPDAAAGVQPQVPPEEPPAAAARVAESSAEPKPDRFEDMDRAALIQYGAKHFKGQRSWATLSEARLRAALRELEAAD